MSYAPSDLDTPGERPDTDEFDETGMPRDGLVALEQVPRVAAAPLAVTEAGLAAFLFFDLPFDEYVEAQRAAFSAEGWTLDDVSLADGRWAFEAAKGTSRTAGGVVDCTAGTVISDGTGVDLCAAAPAGLRRGSSPLLQVNIYLPRP